MNSCAWHVCMRLEKSVPFLAKLLSKPTVPRHLKQLGVGEIGPAAAVVEIVQLPAHHWKPYAPVGPRVCHELQEMFIRVCCPALLGCTIVLCLTLTSPAWMPVAQAGSCRAHSVMVGWEKKVKHWLIGFCFDRQTVQKYWYMIGYARKLKCDSTEFTVTHIGNPKSIFYIIAIVCPLGTECDYLSSLKFKWLNIEVHFKLLKVKEVQGSLFVKLQYSL